MKIYTILLFSFFLGLDLLGSESKGGWIIGWGRSVEATGVSPFKYSTNKDEMMAQYTNSQISWNSTGTVSVAGQVLSNITAVSCGTFHPFALKSDGSMVSWEISSWGTNRGSEFIPPTNLNDVVAIASGEMHYLALKKDGTVIAWGEKHYGAASVPEGLSNVVAIAACGRNSLALKRDGTLVGWGESIKIPSGLSNIVAISSSPASRLGIGRQGNALALKQDGTVIDIEWIDGPSGASVIGGLSNVVAIAAGPVHNLALKKDGTVYAWGFNGNGELNQPPGLTNVVAIAASGSSFPADGYSLALKGDGQIVAWGRMNYHPLTIPEGFSNVVAIAAGQQFCLAITTNRAVAERFRQK